MTGSLYFKHHTDARKHRKIMLLEKKFGDHVGYALYFKTLELMTEYPEIGLPDNEIDIENAAFFLNTNATQYAEFIKYCLSIQIFVNKDKTITAEMLVENMQKIKKTSENISRARKEIEQKKTELSQNPPKILPEKKPKVKPVIEDVEPNPEVLAIRKQAESIIERYLESPEGIVSNKVCNLTNKHITNLIKEYSYPKLSVMIRAFYEWKCKTRKKRKDDFACIKEDWVEEKVADYIKRNNGQLPEPPKYYSQEDVDEIVKLNAAREKQGIRLAKVPEVGSAKAC
jgi:hypothetical protein